MKGGKRSEPKKGKKNEALNDNRSPWFPFLENQRGLRTYAKSLSSSIAESGVKSDGEPGGERSRFVSVGE